MDKGLGLGIVFFWLMIGAISVAAIWARRLTDRERQQTIRSVIDRGQQLDPALLEKVMTPPLPWTQPPARNPRAPLQLLISGIIVVSAGAGLVLMGWCISQLEPRAFWPIVGAGLLVATIGAGLALSGQLARHAQRQFEAGDRRES